jgi:hypothetical protein
MSSGQSVSDIKDTVYWTPQQDKMDQFWAALLSATGISQENIALQNIYHLGSCLPNENCMNNGWDVGIPAPNGYDISDVANPKDIITAALTNLTDLTTQMSEVIDDMRNNVFRGSGKDVIDAIAIPVLMIASAVENMVRYTSPIFLSFRKRDIRKSFSGARFCNS